MGFKCKHCGGIIIVEFNKMKCNKCGTILLEFKEIESNININPIKIDISEIEKFREILYG